MKFTRDLVIKKVNQIFPKEDRERILSILDKCTYPFKERLQLAVLKLCEGKEDNVRKLIKLAEIDHPRDILWPAEEPNLTAAADKMPNMTKKEIEELQEKDHKQYLDWLKSNRGHNGVRH